MVFSPIIVRKFNMTPMITRINTILATLEINVNNGINSFNMEESFFINYLMILRILKSYTPYLPSVFTLSGRARLNTRHVDQRFGHNAQMLIHDRKDSCSAWSAGS